MSAKVLDRYLESSAEPEQALRLFQRDIEGTPEDEGFVCVIDQDGKLLCHSDRTMVGEVLPDLTLERAPGAPASDFIDVLKAATSKLIANDAAGLLRSPSLPRNIRTSMLLQIPHRIYLFIIFRIVTI